MPRDGSFPSLTLLKRFAFDADDNGGPAINRDVAKIAPSILAADFATLGAQIGDPERAGADRIHIDVMDGHFVPNISMGAPIVASLRRVTNLSLETDLMISNPDLFIREFIEAGSECFLRIGKGTSTWEVDGGIDPVTARLTVDAGANILVAGSSVFGDAEGVAAGIKSLTASLDLVKQ